MKRIHIVDDEPTVLRLIGEALHKRGYAVETFDAPERYLETVQKRPDLLITDLLMPGLDGIGFCTALRASPALRTVPIVIVTGLVVRDGMQSDQALRDRFGVQAIINKPFALRHLFDCVERVLGGESAPLAQAPATVAPSPSEPPAKVKTLAAIPLRQMAHQPMTGTRFDPRYDVSFGVAFANAAELQTEYTENISRGGLFVRTPAPPPMGTQVQLQLRVPWEETPLLMTATVAHVVPPGAGQLPGFGCRLSNDDQVAAERWFAIVGRIAEQQQPAGAAGPRVLLLGFSGERVADLMHQAGILCRAELRIVPLASWQSVLREAGKHEEVPKLLVVDVGQSTEQSRALLFNSAMLRQFADIPNVALAFIGLEDGDERDLPTELHVIQAGALTSADLVGAMVSWLRLPERSQVRVAAGGTVSVAAGDQRCGGELLDVSVAGARFLAQEPLHPADGVLLTFRLGPHGAVEDMPAVVRWAKPEGRGRWMCGVAFSVPSGVVDAYVGEQLRYLQTLEGLRRS